MDLKVFQNRKVLITGHTGFKGSWLALWLMRAGAQVIGYALEPKTETDNYVLTDLANKIKDYIADIRDKYKFLNVLNEEKPEIIFHLAAQPLVIESYKNPLLTFETNTIGTANVLDAFRITDSAKLLIIITTDKVYENFELNRGYTENDRLGGKDPYSASKACAEIISNSYLESFFSNREGKKIATVRAGNVVGGGDWSANRIIPDCIKSIEKNEKINIRNPYFTRPWQHVLEPLGGYLLLAERMLKDEKNFVGAWNFGPLNNNNITVEELVRLVIDFYGRGKYVMSSEHNKLKETIHLSLDISKAMTTLNWKPCLDIRETIRYTINWYKNYKNVDVFKLCNQQIEEYEKKWKSVNLN